MGKTVVFFDLECTSISFNPDNVRIIEIAAIKVDLDTLEEIDRLYFKCNNGDVHIAKDAYEVHGISEESVKDLPTFHDRAKEVFESAEGKELLKKWGITDEVEGIGFCILGHALKEKNKTKIMDNRVFYIDEV